MQQRLTSYGSAAGWSLLLALAWSSSAQALTLREAVLAAKQNDPAAIAAEAQFRAEREQSAQILASRRPSASAQAQWSQTDSRVSQTPFGVGFNENYPQWQVGAELRQPIFRFDWLARGDQADASDQLAQANYVTATQSLVADVSERYVAVLRAQDALRSAKAEQDAKARTLQEAKQRLSVGAVAGTEVKEAQARWDLAQAMRLAAEQTLADAIDSLQQSTGLADTQLSVLSAEQALPVLPERSDEEWLALARQHSPSLQRALAQQRIAQAAVTREQSTALPTLDAVASYAQQDTAESLYGSSGSNTAVGVQLQVPLFSGGALRSKIRQARAEAEAADARLAQANKDLQRLLQRSLRSYHTAMAQAHAFAKAAESSAAAEKATRYGYEAGKRTLVDVLNAQSARLSAERERDQSRYAVLIAYIRLQQHVGVLSDNDISTLETLLTQSEVSTHE